MKVRGEMLLREIAGETILIPVGETALRLTGMINLSESGAILWRMLQSGATERQLLNRLTEEYEIDEDTAKADLEDFLNQMGQLDLLQEAATDE